MGWGSFLTSSTLLYIMTVQSYAFSSIPTIIYCWYSDFYILLAYHYIVVWGAEEVGLVIISCGVTGVFEKASNYMLVAIG